MKIELNINNEDLEAAITEGISSLSKETKEEIVKEAFRQYLNSEQAQQAFYETIFNKKNYYNDTLYFSDQGIKLITEIIKNDKEDKDHLYEILADIIKQNGEKIILQAMMEIIIKGFTQQSIVQNAMYESAKITSQQIIDNHCSDYHNPNNY